jgi:ankyrin repeat protein
MKQLLITIAAVVLVGCGESSKNYWEVTGIWKAAKDGNIEAVKQHLAAGTDVNAKNRHGNSPLQLAALMGHKEIVELLIAKGADVNTRSNVGWTPLHNAQGNEIVELLIAEGANVNAEDIQGGTPLDWANGNRNRRTADLLRKHGGKTGGISLADLIGLDEDGDGFDAYDEKITGHSDNDSNDKPTQEVVDAVLAELEAASN